MNVFNVNGNATVSSGVFTKDCYNSGELQFFYKKMLDVGRIMLDNRLYAAK